MQEQERESERERRIVICHFAMEKKVIFCVVVQSEKHEQHKHRLLLLLLSPREHTEAKKITADINVIKIHTGKPFASQQIAIPLKNAFESRVN